MTNVITWFKKFNAESWKLIEKPGAIPALNLNYSVFRKPAANSKFTLWYFHGLFDDQTVPIESMFNQDSLVEMEEAFDGEFPTIVAISFGTEWLFNSDPNRTKNPKTAILQNWPTIENVIRTTHNLQHPYRIAGHSMGGFNATSLVAAYPGQFDKCALINPMLVDCDPFSFNLADPKIRDCLACPVVRMNFNDEAQWQAQGPFALLKQQMQKLPQILVVATPYDNFKLYPAAQTLASILNDKHAPYTWMPHSGDHYHFPGTAVANWLMT